MKPNNFDKIDEIDAERSDEEEPEAVQGRIYFDTPSTLGGLRYPETCVLDFGRGRFPEWYKPLEGFFRRIQKSEREDFGFVTPSYTYLPITALVSSPDTKRAAYNFFVKALEEAGWIMTKLTWTREGFRFSNPSKEILT